MSRSSSRLAVFVSGSGTNLKAIIDAIDSKKIDAKILKVISDREDAYALTRAKNNFIDCMISNDFDEILKELKSLKIDLVVLAGYLKILPEFFIDEFEGRIINIHPSLIPSFCGSGFYGRRVHEACLNRGVKITGATTHLVDRGTDTGKILMQKAVEVYEDDDADTLAKRVLKVEHEILIETIKNLVEERV